MTHKVVTVLVLSTLFLGTLFVSKNLANDNTVVLSKKNLVVLSGEIDGDTVNKAITDAKLINNKLDKLKGTLGLKQDPIYLFMYTPGGSIQAGMELIESLHGLGRPVHTVTLFSASMGFQIVQALGDRLIFDSGVLMSHKASGQFTGSFGGQKPSQLENRYALWYSRMQEFDAQTVKRSKGKQTLESYQKAYDQELWLTGHQSVDGGYADKIVTVKCDSTLDGATTYTVSVFGMKVSYDLDNCPINTSPTNIRVSSPDSTVTLSSEKAEETKAKFLEHYISKQKTVIPAYW